MPHKLLTYKAKLFFSVETECIKSNFINGLKQIERHLQKGI
jgi:hypothetical protein